MLKETSTRRHIIRYNYFKLIASSLLVSVLSCILAYFLKHSTEYFQHLIFNRVKGVNPILFIVCPSIGITLIYFLRKYIFKNRKNKGIKEIYTTLETRKDHLPFFKVPSHFINGFLTVVFGGSTGVEVSTVVASATIGNQTYKRFHSAWAFKTELICAAVAAGVTVLFGSAIGGLLFALEVIARRSSKTLLVSIGVSSLFSFFFVNYFDPSPLLSFSVEEWHISALPYIILLGGVSGLLALFFTKTVIFAKHYFSVIKSNFIRVNLGAITVGILVYFFPYLYGDSYHGVKEALEMTIIDSENFFILIPLTFLIFLKPIVSSLTLGAGGDGGVFAPSIVTGAFLGMWLAILLNHFCGTELIVLNFALFGAVGMLSASIHAPFAAIFIVCSIVPNGFVLFVPLLIVSLIAKILSKRIYPYTVYSYKEPITQSI